MAFMAEEHASECDALAQVWSDYEELGPRHDINLDRKQAIRDHILLVASRVASEREDRPSLRPSLHPLLIFRIKSYAIAATIVLLVGLSFALSPSVQTFKAPVGTATVNTVRLPDGSAVTLAPGSSISFTNEFGKNLRRVSLKGEAFFDVEKNTSPFIVDTYNSRTTVLGTRFSIRAWPTELDASTDVLVEEGNVSVQPLHSNAWSQLLGANEVTSIVGTGRVATEPESRNLEHAFNWTRGGYEYRNEPIGNVLDDLIRRYGVLIEGPTSVLLRPISIFNQSDGNLEEILGDISATIDIKYRQISGGYELYELK